MMSRFASGTLAEGVTLAAGVAPAAGVALAPGVAEVVVLQAPTITIRTMSNPADPAARLIDALLTRT
jgi:hypothetical protein